MIVLLWFILSLAELFRHVYIRRHLNRSPNKRLSFLLRFTIGATLSLLDPYPHSAEKFLLYILLGWCTHDYLQNLFMGTRPIWYLNGTGPIDRFQNRCPNSYVWFVWKLIALVGAGGIYFFN